MDSSNLFKVLLLLARPAAGKSEIIHYLKNLPPDERMSRFHMGKLAELDDFPMIWTWFEEDALLEQMGHARLHTDREGYFLYQYLWDLLIKRMGLEYTKLQRDLPGFGHEYTTLMEFSRGSEHGGYASAFQHLSKDLLEQAAVLYVDVPWEESLRKNRKRFNPEKPDSILEHSLPDTKLDRLYREVDWPQVSAEDPSFLNIQGRRIPFVVFDNADDVTTKAGEALGVRLQEVLDNLWQIRQLER